MRNLKEFIVDIVKKPPMLFPLVGLFHILWLLWTIWICHDEPFPSIIWLEVLWMAGYTVTWIAACDLQKWGQWGYISLTLVNTALFIAFRNGLVSSDLKNNMVFLDVLFSCILLYYNKKFSPQG